MSDATGARDDVAETFVAGVDGCPGGWVVVVRLLDQPARATVRLCASFADVLAIDLPLAMIAVDIPIGLPERIGTGGRGADVAARRVLGARKSAVFSVPSRAAVMEIDYRRACDLAVATSDPPRKISKQAFNLFPKIREVDAAMTPELQARVREVHPEVAFAALNGWVPLDLAKKVKSQPSPEGLAYRRALLQAAGYEAALFETRFRRADVGPDDVLDAAVNSWTAARLVAGAARCFPDHPDTDAKGLRCEIWG